MYPVVIIVLFLVLWVISLHASIALPDHLARWTAGRLIAEGNAAELYDPTAQSNVQAALGAKALSWFVSPPYVAIAFVPFGLLPYAASALLWTAIAFALLFWSLRAASRLHPSLASLSTGRVLLVVFSCQVVLELFGGGQDSVVVLAAMVGSATLLQRDRPFTAGLLLSCAAIKPQLAILIPVVLVLGHAWRVLIGAGVGGVLLVGATSAVLGWATWWDWLEALRSPLYQVEVVDGQAWKATTLQGLIDSLGGHAYPAGMAVVWLVAAGMVVLATGRRLRAFGPGAVPTILITVVPLVTVLITPHAMVYDLVVVIPAVVWLIDRHGSAAVRSWVACGFVLLLVAPLLHLTSRAAPWPLSVAGAPWVVVPLTGLWWVMIGNGPWWGRAVDTGGAGGSGGSVK